VVQAQLQLTQAVVVAVVQAIQTKQLFQFKSLVKDK
jgi:hypothetical protein